MLSPGVAVQCEIIGGTNDLSAGQLIDRAGQLLGLRFPSGKELDALAASATKEEFYSPKVNGMEFSLSGVEHKMKQLYEGANTEEEQKSAALAAVFGIAALEGRQPPLGGAYYED